MFKKIFLLMLLVIFSVGCTRTADTVSNQAVEPDTTTIAVTLSASDNTLDEASGSSTVTVTFSSESEYICTVNLSVSGTATNNVDYTIGSTQLLMPANSLTITTNIVAIDDDSADGDQTITIDIDTMISGSDSYILEELDDLQQVTLTIADNDNTSTASVYLEIDQDNIAEDIGTITVNAILTEGLDNASTINLLLSGTAGSDDYSIDSSSIVIPAGSTSNIALISIIDDSAVESSETISVTIESINGDNLDIDSDRSTVTFTLTDNDSTEVNLSVDSNNVAENSGSDITVTLSLTNATDTDTDIELVLSGTASESDYSIADTELTIAAGETSASTTISLIDDSTSESDETIIVELSDISNSSILIGTDSAEITIDDNDASEVSVSIDSDSLIENSGDSVNVTVTLSNATIDDTDITLGLGGTATLDSDYSIDATTLTIPANSLTVTTVIDLIDDSVEESDETITVNITDVSNELVSIDSDTVTFTIIDNETTEVYLSVDSIVNEGDTNFIVTANITNATHSDTTVTIALSGTAVEDADYTISEFSMIIPAEGLSATMSIALIDDSVMESDETITFEITDVSNSLVDISSTEPSVTIEDNDSSTLQLSASSGQVEEDSGTEVEITLSLSESSDSDTVVTLNVAGSATIDSDYSIDSTTLTIPANSVSVTTLITLLSDSIIESDETITLNISAVSNDSITFSSDSFTGVTIENDDSAVANIVVDDSSIDEDSDSNEVTVTLELTNVADSDTDITLDLGGTASEGSDYSIAATTLTVPSNEDSITTVITLTDDSVVESDETVTIGFNSISNSFISDGSVAEVTINENDVATVNLALDATSISEDNGPNVALTATLTTTSDSDTVINLNFYGTADSGDDYDSDVTSITISAGDLTNSGTFTLIDDTITEISENVFIEITDVDNSRISAGPTVNIEIGDDEQVTIYWQNHANDELASGVVTGLLPTSISSLQGTLIDSSLDFYAAPVVRRVVDGSFEEDHIYVMGTDGSELSIKSFTYSTGTLDERDFEISLDADSNNDNAHQISLSTDGVYLYVAHANGLSVFDANDGATISENIGEDSVYSILVYDDSGADVVYFTTDSGIAKVSPSDFSDVTELSLSTSTSDGMYGLPVVINGSTVYFQHGESIYSCDTDLSSCTDYSKVMTSSNYSSTETAIKDDSVKFGGLTVYGDGVLYSEVGYDVDSSDATWNLYVLYRSIGDDIDTYLGNDDNANAYYYNRHDEESNDYQLGGDPTGIFLVGDGDVTSFVVDSDFVILPGGYYRNSIKGTSGINKVDTNNLSDMTIMLNIEDSVDFSSTNMFKSASRLILYDNDSELVIATHYNTSFLETIDGSGDSSIAAHNTSILYGTSTTDQARIDLSDTDTVLNSYSVGNGVVFFTGDDGSIYILE